MSDYNFIRDILTELFGKSEKWGLFYTSNDVRLQNKAFRKIWLRRDKQGRFFKICRGSPLCE